MAMRILFQPDLMSGHEAANEPLGEVQTRLALQGFLTDNYEVLKRKLVRHLGCPDMAGECLHDAWLRLANVEVRAAVLCPEAYVYRMACNVAMDRVRANRSWQYVGDGEQLDGVMDVSPGPEQIAAARSELAVLSRAMGQLSRRHRSVLLALRVEGKTREEVAAHFNLSLRSVDTALRHALDHCRQA